MTLRELDAVLLRIAGDGTYEHVERLSQAQGVSFACPKCYVSSGNSLRGVHSVLCWFADRNVPADLPPLPGRWHPMGTTVDDLEFTGPGAFSVKLEGGCGWHGYVKRGRATILPS